jgi:hypothetical protein
MKSYFKPLLLLAAIVSVFAIISKAVSDTNYHPICDTKSKPAGCYKTEDYVQNRRCEDPGKRLCFGTANDGWDTDRMGSLPGLWPEPFEYATIEYRTDLQGEARRFEPLQVDSIVSHIDEMVRSRKSLLLVVFVHGWHHSARESRDDLEKNGEPEIGSEKTSQQDGNLLYFKHILAKSSHELTVRRSPQHVLGIYIGWNGGPDNAYLNIGSRARAADRLGNSVDFAMDMQKLKAALGTDPSNKMLLLGHSFGGRVLSRYMLHQISNEHNWEPLGGQSLVATINPAIGADAFDDVMTTPTDEKNPLPSWINLTSKDDPATGFAFRVAASLGRPALVGWGVSNKVFARSAYSAIGHFRPYQTHFLTLKHVPSKDEACSDSVNCVDHCPLMRTAENEKLFLPPAGRQTLWYETADNPRPMKYLAGAGCSSKFYFTTLTTASHPVPGRLWNIATDRNMIDVQPSKDGKKAAFARHNAFVQTSLVRMLIELLFAKQPGAG